MILVVMSGRNPTMRHIGRVHGISVQRMHEHLDKHPGKDKAILFYQDTHAMSAHKYIYIQKALVLKIHGITLLIPSMFFMQLNWQTSTCPGGFRSEPIMI